jgi:protein Tex
MQTFLAQIVQITGLRFSQVTSTLKLFEEGSTTPFIARYRKEMTGSLDEVQIEQIKNLQTKYSELEKRKLSIESSIKEQGKWNPQLEQAIANCWELHLLEDIYLPYKPKRKTKASIAREKGLEPLALWLLQENETDVENHAKSFLNKEVVDTDEALQGARDIIAEIINEDAEARNLVRIQFQQNALVQSKVVKGKEEEGSKYKDYFQFSEPWQKCPSHRILAVFRAEQEDILRLYLQPDEEECIPVLQNKFIRKKKKSSQQIDLALKDAYKRLLSPSIETEFRNSVKAKADAEAIQVFTDNLRQLLLSPPLGSKRILALDPGFRSGCKVVCLNEEGLLLHDTVIYPHEPQNEKVAAQKTILQLVQDFKVQAIAIGNGTAGRETEDFIEEISFPLALEVFMVNENGASIYSASEVAREEFPEKDLTVRGAVSIGRRLADPLAELVKIDAKSIGVGQYQHDVDQSKLKQSLDAVVERCVNQVGVNLNTASKSLLTYVAGLNEQTAQNIIQYRNQNGAFKSRNELKKVARLGNKTFEQCAGFLRIPNADNILDNTAVHPESYGIVEAMAKQNNCGINDFIKNEQLRKNIDAKQFINEQAGMLTVKDILNELAKPGRDPREQLKPFKFAAVKKPEDLTVGMILPGIVSNITKFGCFVDIGVKQDGMVHISQMADKFVSDPNSIVKLQQQVQVKVLEVDLQRKRIGLSMKGM